MATNLKSLTLRIIITAIALIFVLDFFFKAKLIQDTAFSLQRFVIPIGGFALGLGGITMGLYYARRIMRKDKFWQYDIAGVLSMLFMGLLGFLEASPQPILQWYTYNIVTPIEQAIWSALAFYLASASIRALRAKSVETALLLAGAIFVMIGNAPVGPALWPASADIARWFMDVPNMAEARGINLIVAFGTFLLAARVFLGRERTILG